MTIEHEYALLGAYLKDNSLVYSLPLAGGEFANDRHNRVYRAIRNCVDRGIAADLITVTEALQREGAMGAELELVADIIRECPGTVNAKHYHRSVRDKGAVREAKLAARELAEVTDKVHVGMLASRLMALCRETYGHETTQNESVRSAIDHLEALQDGTNPGLPTGLTALDSRFGGMQPSDLIVIAARSQHGKTALMMNIANAQSVPVGIISGEQPHVQLGLRSIAMRGEVDLKDMRTGRLSDDQWRRIGEAAKNLHDRQVFIYDRGSPSIAEIEVQARQWAFHKGIRALFVDYLQLVTGGEGAEHRLQIGDVARRLKALAKDLKIPVIALAQIGRAIDKKPEGSDYLGRMPYTSDLADSAQIEDAADQILCLYRPEVYWPSIERLKGLAFVNVAKNRHGPTGFVAVEWIGKFVTFRDRAA